MKQVNKCQVFMYKFTINWHLSKANECKSAGVVCYNYGGAGHISINC